MMMMMIIGSVVDGHSDGPTGGHFRGCPLAGWMGRESQALSLAIDQRAIAGNPLVLQRRMMCCEWTIRGD